MSSLAETLALMTPEELETFKKITGELNSTGKSETLSEIYSKDFDEIPVTFKTFVTSPKYIGSNLNLYDFWQTVGEDIFSETGETNYTEIAFTGGIGIGKSMAAVVMLLYTTYKIMCLKVPQDYFGISRNKPVSVLFFNITLELAEKGIFREFQNVIQQSPWFMERGTTTGRTNLIYKPDKNVSFIFGSQPDHAIGKDVFAAVVDEVNFSRGKDQDFLKSSIMETINTINKRISSRFTIGGKNYGALFIISSKKSTSDFLESYIKKRSKIGLAGFKVVDARTWDTKPKGTYSGKTFKLAVGGVTLESKIVGKDDNVEDLINLGYEIEEIPVEERKHFEMDINRALMDIAGISVTDSLKFLSAASLMDCYCKDENPFTKNVLTIGMKDPNTVIQYFKPEMVHAQLKRKPLFIHIDTSLTGDRTGISCVAAMGYSYTDDYNLEEGTIEPTKKIIYKHIFSVAIDCPKNSEISFQKTRNFIYALKSRFGFNVVSISLDSFQSYDTKQQLISMGFDDTVILSLDRVTSDRCPLGYSIFKSAVNEGRIALINIPELHRESINLEQNNLTGKVDHNSDNSKDMIDSLAGCVYNASLHEGSLDLEQVSLLKNLDTTSTYSNNPSQAGIDFGNMLNNNILMSYVKLNDEENTFDYSHINTDDVEGLTEAERTALMQIRIKREMEAKGKDEIKPPSLLDLMMT